MPVRACRVTIRDMSGLAHTLEVTASSRFEAIAFALTTLRATRRLIPDGFAPVRVRIVDGSAEYEVRLRDFARWLDRRGSALRK
jgi:hypothetical protein